MFIRYSNYGKNRYCQIVESYRDESKKPKHRIIMGLGKVDENGVPLDAGRLADLAGQINVACGIISKEEAKRGKNKHKA
jgi:hypothetical protein